MYGLSIHGTVLLLFRSAQISDPHAGRLRSSKKHKLLISPPLYLLFSHSRIVGARPVTTDYGLWREFRGRDIAFIRSAQSFSPPSGCLLLLSAQLSKFPTPPFTCFSGGPERWRLRNWTLSPSAGCGVDGLLVPPVALEPYGYR